ncbi:xanthine dehydrogenase small subunit [Aquincola sp. S2]|uniref:Xanthine dehydrogenase small subunit n=1 Tax=Pseudaquabacterium terrae TaxID=2732868 RepID=A0ABX2EEL1_9BURK|nr:xanthine dehydrogenase small subunit [Aquabacterium terrae]NRF67046.1 xanthine dehydrogenase small subunit [Aquabacterium terrae]
MSQAHTSAPSASGGGPAATPDTVRPVRFFHRGEIVSLDDVSPTRTVLNWLREDAHCTGTKEGCNEGDCGACTVMVGELHGEHIAWQTVNACIQFVPVLDGKALMTVEDLAKTDPQQPAAAAVLHPVQQAMVDCHGSQCGFCTPGFVMSMTACYERHQALGTQPTRQELADELSGNLCRCTGYRPILDAGQRMFELPVQRIDEAPIAAALRSLRNEPPLRRPDFRAPRTLADFAALRAAKPEARLLAGCTDIGLWVNKQFRDLGEILYIGEVAELKAIGEVDGMLEIGAGASLEDAWSALSRHWPAVREMHLRFASPPIRHAGTMGGNIANGSPIGDSAPVLIALGASIVLRHGEAVREMPLEDFYVDYMKNRLEPGEFVQALRVPLPRASQVLRAYKLSKRYDSDISGLACGLWLQLDGEIVRDARFAFGGMAAIVKRAKGAEAALRGHAWNEATLQAAMAALDSDYTPLSDLRASDNYRRRAARNLLQRLFLETRPASPLSTKQISVWSDIV